MGKSEKPMTKEEELTNHLVSTPNVKVPYQLIYIIGFDWLLVIVSAFGSLCSGAIPLVFYLLIGRLIDVLAPPDGPEKSYSRLVRGVSDLLSLARFDSALANLMKYMGIVVAIAFGVNFVSSFCVNVAYERFGVKLRRAYFRALVRQEIAYFDVTKTGSILKNVTDDITMIQESFTVKVAKCCEFAAQAIVGIILSFTISWSLTLVMLSSGPVIAILGSIAAAINDLLSKRTNRINARGTSILNEVVGAMRTVRSMAGEEKEDAKFRANSRSIIPFTVAKSILLGLLVGCIIGLGWASSLITFWVGGRFIKREIATVGELLQVLGMVALGVIGASQAMAIVPEFAKAIGASRSLLNVITRTPAIRFKGGLTLNELTGNIEFKNIVFRYPSRPDVVVLKNFSLSVSAGQNVALVGQSGSGKSTIVGLLERFYEAESGDVLVDGVNIKEIDPQWLHKHIGIVTQEPTLFATTIKKNITYAVSQYREVSDEEVTKAAKDANAHDFIISLPDGYNTMLGERGVSLSGGQKQRIAIARAMIQNPSVLLLDEATSALDTESESLVQDALSKLMKGRTSIVIAHRLSTIQNADVIVVMTRGEIVEMGTHNELIAKQGGVYAKLAAKQMKFGESSEEESDAETSESESLIPVVADEIDAHNL